MGGDVAARKFISQHHLQVRRHAQLHQLEVALRKVLARLFVEDDRRFERRPGEAVLDARDGVPQVQQARRLFALLQQAQQAAPQQSGPRKKWLAVRGPQQEDRRLIGQCLDRGIHRRQIAADFDRGHH